MKIITNNSMKIVRKEMTFKVLNYSTLEEHK